MLLMQFQCQRLDEDRGPCSVHTNERYRYLLLMLGKSRILIAVNAHHFHPRQSVILLALATHGRRCDITQDHPPRIEA